MISVSHYLQEGLYLVAIISGVPLLISTILSLGIAVIQAATQIQEQSIGFFMKITSIAVIMLIGGGVFWSWSIEFFQKLFDSLQYVQLS